jgi:predicted nucleic acid-binding protein
LSLLFDASALINIVKRLGAEALKLVKGNYALTLTVYEVGNAVWKEHKLLKRLTADEALKLLEALLAMLKFVRVVEPSDPVKALILASELNVTFYDASYIVAAAEHSSALVTDDTRLRKRVESNSDIVERLLGRRVTLMSSGELAGSQGKGLPSG